MWLRTVLRSVPQWQMALRLFAEMACVNAQKDVGTHHAAISACEEGVQLFATWWTAANNCSYLTDLTPP